jgi:hypothetical protein
MHHLQHDQGTEQSKPANLFSKGRFFQSGKAYRHSTLWCWVAPRSWNTLLLADFNELLGSWQPEFALGSLCQKNVHNPGESKSEQVFADLSWKIVVTKLSKPVRPPSGR